MITYRARSQRRLDADAVVFLQCIESIAVDCSAAQEWNGMAQSLATDRLSKAKAAVGDATRTTAQSVTAIHSTFDMQSTSISLRVSHASQLRTSTAKRRFRPRKSLPNSI